LAVLLMVGFQTFMLIRTGENLRTVRAAQEQPLQDGTKIRQRLETLASRTATLAQEGDANAQAIVETMRRQGVNMTPGAKEGAPKVTP
jgi:hypothetical protein